MRPLYKSRHRIIACLTLLVAVLAISCQKAEPEPTVAVFEMGDSSVNLVVRPWCNGDDYWKVWFEVTQAVKEGFDANDVTIPFPQRDVHLFQEAAS